MKTIFKYIFSVALGSIMLTSCDLDTIPTTYVDAGSVFGKTGDAEKVLNGGWNYLMETFNSYANPGYGAMLRVVQILQYLSKEESLKAFVIWTMGALGDVTSGQLLILVPSVFAGLLLAVLTIKPLNLLLFGEEYAVTMGLNIRRSRSLLFLSTTLLAGTITAFCGPIGFIGLAMPHVTRMLFQNSDHHVLLPGTILSGASILLLCDIISKIFTLPINAITALLGIPIVVWVVLRNKSITA